ncbi:MAG: S53 family peptidase, partial [Janthinobacterium lividum]
MAKTVAKKTAASKPKSNTKQAFSEMPRVALPGSNRPALAGSTADTRLKARAQITVSVIVRRKQSIPASAIEGGVHLSRAQYRASHGADPEAVKAVTAFAKEFGLSAAAEPARRTVFVTGTVSDLQTAFGVMLYPHTADGQTLRLRRGDICLPESLIPYVEAVLGLDNRPQTVPHFRVVEPRASSASFTPVQVAQLYKFPTGGAKGQTIALIELGGGFRAADITAYFKALGVAAPKVTAVLVDKAKNAPTTADGADGEVMLDIDVAGGAAPGANIAVYFAPNTDQGFVDAITTAIHDTAN